MVILELAKEIGLDPFRAAATKGGEYKSSCPECGGHDRFCIWPKAEKGGEYWCRSCGKHGDAIQFCRDFLGMSFGDALRKLNLECSTMKVWQVRKSHRFAHRPVESIMPNEVWKERAVAFVIEAYQRLLKSPDGIDLLAKRGINLDSVHLFRLGWNAETVFEPRALWGLSEELGGNGMPRKQWMPQGLVIPIFEHGSVVQVKIRRTEWHDDDRLPKYAAISGSKKGLTILGNVRSVYVVVESEFDGILILQEAGDLCSVLPLGGVAKTPDRDTHDKLGQASALLLALDFDEVGKKHTKLWMRKYPKSRAWPAPVGKSPGDAFKDHGVNLREWISGGMRRETVRH